MRETKRRQLLAQIVGKSRPEAKGFGKHSEPKKFSKERKEKLFISQLNDGSLFPSVKSVLRADGWIQQQYAPFFVALSQFEYERRGRGLLVAPGFLPIETEKGIEFVLEFFYCTASDLPIECLEAKNEPIFLEAIEGYNTKQEAGLFFIYAGEYINGRVQIPVSLDTSPIKEKFAKKDFLIINGEEDAFILHKSICGVDLHSRFYCSVMDGNTLFGH